MEILKGLKKFIKKPNGGSIILLIVGTIIIMVIVKACYIGMTT